MFTIEEILKRKEKIDKAKDEKIFIELDGQEMVFNKCDMATFNDVITSEGNKDAKLIYYTCINPNFKDNMLIEKLGVKHNPSLAVEKVFTASEIIEIADKILELSEIKNKNLELKARIGSI